MMLNEPVKQIQKLMCSPSEELVCHYTKLDTVERIIGSQKLRLSPLKDVNDPRENTVRRFESDAFCGDARPCDYAEWEEFIESANQRFRNQTKIFCGTLDSKHPPKQKSVLGRGFGRPRMWAQYADAHKGACLLFDRECLTTELAQALHCGPSDIRQKKVCYGMTEASSSVLLLDYYIYKRLGEEVFWSQHIDQFGDSLLFHKHHDWEGENEWRFVFMDRRNDGNYAFVHFNNALKYIIVGCECDAKSAVRITQLSHIPVLRIVYEYLVDDYSLVDPYVYDNLASLKR